MVQLVILSFCHLQLVANLVPKAAGINFVLCSVDN